MAQGAQIGFLRAVWLLLRLQQTRTTRQLTGGFRLFQKKETTPKRTATASKSRRGWLIAGWVMLSLIFFGLGFSFKSIRNFQATVGSTVTVSAPPASSTSKPKQSKTNQQQPAPSLSTPLPADPGFVMPSTVLNAVAMQTVILLVAIALLAMGGGELTQQDWDLEWLVTLPVGLSTLLCSRILARAFGNTVGLFAFWTLLFAVAVEAGYETKALLISCAATIPLLIIAATVQTMADTGLRLRLGPPQLRNLQAFVSVAASIAILLAMSPGLPAQFTIVADLASVMPRWTFWLPPGLAVQAMASSTAQGTAQSLALLVLETIIFLSLGLVLLTRQLRSGVVAGGARESTRTERPRTATKASRKEAGGQRWLTPVQARELRLLGRDRNFFVQTLIMPIILAGCQILFNQGAGTWLSSLNAHPEYIAIAAFGVSAYGLMFSAFQTLNAEGQALWMLYTFPTSLETVLRQKAFLWGIAALLYPVAFFSFAAVYYGATPTILQLAIVVLLGVPVFSIIATSLGVFACDPLASNVQRRIKLSYTYLYFFLSSTYVYSIYADSIWQRLSLLILTTLLAFALWQKARDYLPYLLDPASSPPARVSLSDGLIAALLFFVLQGFVLLLRTIGSNKATGFDVLVAFSVAGALTYGIMRLAFWRLKSEGVPRTFGRGSAYAVVLGALGGAAAAIAAILYLQLPLDLYFPGAAQQIGKHPVALIAILAVIAAPIFEEFIFRGLIFGGLRRSMGLLASVLASAAIFAIVHPPISVIPVFVLGIVTALIYERTKLLAGPMTAHAVYNAGVIGFQFLL